MMSGMCDLCGLPLRDGGFGKRLGDLELRFCCAGCRMVYAMLLEAADAPDPTRFKQTDLYRRCVAAGVVPASEEDLAAALNATAPMGFGQDIRDDQDRTLVLQGRVAGMWCPACAWVIQSCMERLPGVWSAGCDFSTDRLTCRYDPTITAPLEIVGAASRLGYTVSWGNRMDGSDGQRRESIRLIVCGLLAANVMMLSWALYSGFFVELSAQGIGYLSWPIVVMATVVLVYGGGPIWRKAWTGVRAKAPGMELLIALGAGSAYLYSLVNVGAGSLHLYFDTATMLITLVLLGKWLEAQAKYRVRQELEGFLALRPTKVRVCTPEFVQGRYVAMDQLRPGDSFRVEADEIVPADGLVSEGRATIDASAVTGEPEPLLVQTGEQVTSGSRVVDGWLRIEAHRVGDDALIGQMIAIVQSSLERQTPLEGRTQRWLAVFVPVLIGLAAITAAVGYALGLDGDQALVRAVTVLVIACPCALGIAIPLVRVAGISEAGRSGLLVREFDAFEQALHIDTLVFDKTGTVTQGAWTLNSVELRAGLSTSEVLGLALGLEQQADHRVARAIEAYAGKQGIVAIAIRAITQADDGVAGWWDDQAVKIGSLGFVTGIPVDGAAQHNQSQQRHLLESTVYLSLDGKVVAVFCFSDGVRDHMDLLVRHLQQKGVDLHLISGDSDAATQALASAIGLARARGGLLPGDKADYIQQLQQRGERVAMIGDGINDAPAMAQADLAVAMHGRAPLAHQVASVTLMRGDPLQLIEFLSWSAKIQTKVRQNLGWAWAYNLIAIPVAMAGLLTPLVAVTAMLLSSLTVIGNTLMLVWRPGWQRWPNAGDTNDTKR